MIILILIRLFIDRDKHAGIFPGEMCLDHKIDGCGQKKPESIKSAIFGVSTPAKCCKFKRSDVQTEFAAEHNKDEFLEGKFRNLNFSPSTKKTTEYSFELFLSINR